MEFEAIPGGLAVRAPAKINLYLEVGGLRDDGFHEIDTLMQTVSVYDRLEFRATDDGEVTLDEDGIAEGRDNLVHRAAVSLRDSALPGAPRTRAGARISLAKGIPHGAGLGGGSSDAAATLVALAKLWNVEATSGELSALGADLGSDVPFFLFGGTARCRGRGELVTPYHDVFDDAAPFAYVLVCPSVHTPTKAVYDALDEARGVGFTLTASSALDSIDPSLVFRRLRRGEVIFNRLEDVTCGLYPELAALVTRMRGEPFLAVSMTGSGSAFYGLCASAGEAATLGRRIEEDDMPPGTRVLRVKSRPSVRVPWIRGVTR